MVAILSVTFSSDVETSRLDREPPFFAIPSTLTFTGVSQGEKYRANVSRYERFAGQNARNRFAHTGSGGTLFAQF